MRKIPEDYDNPIDNWLTKRADALLPTFRALHMSPNHVTMLSIAFALAAIIALAKGKLVVFVISYTISYFFDVADGHYARSDNKVTKLGDKLDHYSDQIASAAILAILVYKIGWRNVKRPPVIALFLAIGACFSSAATHLGCQQQLYNNSGIAEDLDGLKRLCPSEGAKNRILLTRWVGVGTSQIAFVSIVAYLAFKYGRT